LLGSPSVRRFVLQSNVLMRGSFGIKGGGTGEGVQSIDHYAPGARVRENVMVGTADPSVYPAGNFFSSTLADVGFVNAAAGNYRLSASNPAARGGVADVVGADIDRVESETRGAVITP